VKTVETVKTVKTVKMLAPVKAPTPCQDSEGVVKASVTCPLNAGMGVAAQAPKRRPAGKS